MYFHANYAYIFACSIIQYVMASLAFPLQVNVCVGIHICVEDKK